MDKLEEIMAAKRQSLEHRIRPVKASELEALANSNHSNQSFFEALARPDRLSVIAEIKRKSPSAGAIAEGANAVEQARIYHNADADALSILTDTDYFGGRLNDLWDVVDFLRQHEKIHPACAKTSCFTQYKYWKPLKLVLAVSSL